MSSVPNLPPPPVGNDVSGASYRDWFYKAYQYLKQLTALALGGTVTSVDITAGTGISSSGGPITTSGSITVTNTDLGSSQNIFKNIAVSGQDTVVADSNDDTLTLVAGSNITITTDATTDSITINSSGGGGDYNIDGGVADSVYTPEQNINGGSA
jgi:hypothetical protein